MKVSSSSTSSSSLIIISTDWISELPPGKVTIVELNPETSWLLPVPPIKLTSHAVAAWGSALMIVRSSKMLSLLSSTLKLLREKSTRVLLDS